MCFTFNLDKIFPLSVFEIRTSATVCTSRRERCADSPCGQRCFAVVGVGLPTKLAVDPLDCRICRPCYCFPTTSASRSLLLPEVQNYQTTMMMTSYRRAFLTSASAFVALGVSSPLQASHAVAPITANEAVAGGGLSRRMQNVALVLLARSSYVETAQAVFARHSRARSVEIAKFDLINFVIPNRSPLESTTVI